MKKGLSIAAAMLCASSAYAQPCTQQVIASYSPGLVCVGRTLNLSASTVTGATSYTWSGPMGFFSIGQNPVVSPVQASHGGSYIVTATAGSCVYRDTVVVTLSPSPTTPVLTSGTPPCLGSNFSLAASGTPVPGVNYNFFDPAGAPFGGTIWGITPAHNGTYKAVASTTAGCVSDTATYNLQVISLPTPVLQADTPICSGDTLNLFVNPNTSTVDNYYWNVPGTGPFYTQPGPLSLPNTNVSGFYSVQTVYNSCYSPVAYVLVNFAPSVLPTVTATADGNINAGYTELEFTAQVINGGAKPTLQWYRNGNSIPGATDSVYRGRLFTDVFPLDQVYVAALKDSACGGVANSNIVHVQHVLSVHEAANPGRISVYPNPNSGSFMMSAELRGPADVSIYNPLGQEVYRNHYTSTTSSVLQDIHLPNAAPGIYTLRISAGSSVHNLRITIL